MFRSGHRLTPVHLGVELVPVARGLDFLPDSRRWSSRMRRTLMMPLLHRADDVLHAYVRAAHLTQQ